MRFAVSRHCHFVDVSYRGCYCLFIIQHAFSDARYYIVIIARRLSESKRHFLEILLDEVKFGGDGRIDTGLDRVGIRAVRRDAEQVPAMIGAIQDHQRATAITL